MSGKKADVRLPIAGGGRLLRAALYGALVGLAVIVVSSLILPNRYLEMQSAVGWRLERLIDETSPGRVRRGALVDIGLAVFYAIVGVVALLCLLSCRRRRVRPQRGPAWFAVVAFATAAAADVFENLLLYAIAGRVGEGRAAGAIGEGRIPGALDEAMRVFGGVKWSGIGLALTVAFWYALRPTPADTQSLPSPTAPIGSPTKRTEGSAATPPDDGAKTSDSGTDHSAGEERRRARVHRVIFGSCSDQPRSVADAVSGDDRTRAWEPPAHEQQPRLGICCSGGGIRSAAFSLGALQVLDERGLLREARYLAAVSGGGYMAAGLAVAHSRSAGGAVNPPLYGKASPEERHFRNNSSYLIPSFFRALPGIATLLFGVAVNVVLVWLLVSVLARPVGWLLSAVHPELRAKQPAALVDRATANVGVAFDDIAEIPSTPPGEPDDVRWFEVPLIPLTGDGQGACVDLLPTRTERGDAAFNIVAQTGSPDTDTASRGHPAILEVKDGEAAVRRQPHVVASAEPVADGDCAPEVAASSGDAAHDERDEVIKRLGDTVEVAVQPRLKVEPEIVLPADAPVWRSYLTVERQPRLRPEVGLVGRDRITMEPPLWWVSVVPLGVAVLLTAARVLLRLEGRWRCVVVWSQRFSAALGVGLFAVLIVLPWATQWLPGALADLYGWLTPGAGAPLDDAVPSPLVPGAGMFVLAVEALRRFLLTNQSTAAPSGPAPAGSWWQKPWRVLSGARQPLGWYELSVGKILAGIVVVAVPVVLFVQFLVYASANGVGGKLLGMGWYQRLVPSVLWPPEWLKLVMAVAFLVAFQRLVDAHAWSLHPFYKRRLSGAYLVERRGDAAAEVPYGEWLPFHELQNRGFPQLILGCAVNLSEVGVTPPGRRASSFTFSSTEIGGPLVGYCHPENFWNAVGAGRRNDITIPAAMSISGAAFSPAMGKFNLGPVGSIYAVANLRLGVWLPHPAHVGQQTYRWVDRPGWSWYVREVLNLYRRKSPYLYVSDGGHWENLGLVELLRRGCTRIICINGGGDRQENFGTIGEAIALAREELGVEITFTHPQPTDLRPPLKASDTGRLLRRKGSKDVATPLASASFAFGRFEYPCGTEGSLWLLEPALTAAMPFDVFAHAEGEVVFPDDSTADQVFNHRQFESFRALGAYQASTLFG